MRLQRVQGQHGEEGVGSAGDACHGAQVEGVLREQRPRLERGGVRDVRGEWSVARALVFVVVAPIRYFYPRTSVHPGVRPDAASVSGTNMCPQTVRQRAQNDSKFIVEMSRLIADVVGTVPRLKQVKRETAYRN